MATSTGGPDEQAARDAEGGDGGGEVRAAGLPAAAPETRPGTRAGGLWVSVAVALVVLLVLAVFILENGQHVKVSFFGAHGSLPLGVALLLAAVFGGLVVVAAGTVRILQLRRRARRAERSRSPARSG